MLPVHNIILISLVDSQAKLSLLSASQAVDSGKVVASLRAFVHFSAKLSLSAQKTIGSRPDLDNWNTSPGDIPSYNSKFFYN